MSDNIAVMAGVQDKVRERIQAAFMDLIPAEAWEQMVGSELTAFANKELPRIVREEAEKRLRELISDELKKPEWADRWGVSGGLTSAALEDILRKAAPDLVAAMFSNIGQMFIGQLRNQRTY